MTRTIVNFFKSGIADNSACDLLYEASMGPGRLGRHNYYFPLMTISIIRPFFFNYLVYGSADPIFQDFEKNKKEFFLNFCKKNYFFLIFLTFLFLQIFSCRSQARIKEED